MAEIESLPHLLFLNRIGALLEVLNKCLDVKKVTTKFRKPVTGASLWPCRCSLIE
jgi:hypothetical protein